MPNTLTPLIPKILSRAILPLREQVPMARTVFSDFSSEVAQKGNTIDVKIWPAATTSVVTPGPTDPTPSNTTAAVVQITLDQWKKSDFHLTEKELMDIDADVHFIPPALDEAIRALANDIETDISANYLGVYGYVGTAGTTPFATDTAAAVNARKVLANQLAPAAPRFAVINPDAEANALSLAAFQDADKAGDTGPKIEGNIGRKFGIEWNYTTQVPSHTAGTAAGATTDATGYAVGLKTITLASAGTGSILVGDIITFAGDTQTYVVTSGDASVAGGGTISFEPGLKVAIPTSATAITLKATHVVNLVYHPKAFALAMRPVAVPRNKQDQMMSMTDPETGLSFTLTILDQYHQQTWELSALFGAKLLRAEYAVRVAG